jgi:ABC-type sugar transport system permease subunit
MTVTGLLWDSFLTTTDSPINAIIRLLGFDPPVWLGNPHTALPVVVAVTIWQFSGFPMILFLAAMETIPRDLEESAYLEGASPVQQMRHIVLPLIKPVVAVVVLLQLIFSFKVFDIIWVMTRGGPGDASLVLGVYVYRAGFQFQRFGYASSIAVVVGVIILVMTLIYLRFVRPQSYEH